LVGVVIAGGLFLSHADHAAAQELIGPELSTFERDGDGVAMEGPSQSGSGHSLRTSQSGCR
jgi:hypothetical protein